MIRFCKPCGIETERNKDGTCKPCRRAACKRWAAKYPEKVKVREAKRDKAENCARARRYYHENSEMIAQKAAEQRKINPEKGRRYARQWYAMNTELAKSNARARYHANKEQVAIAFAARYKSKYKAAYRERNTGWSAEMFDRAWEAQKGNCAICNSPMRNFGQFRDSVSADHCHKTDKPRGLLCQDCNVALGRFKDDPELLRKAATYVEQYK
jgi:hypothetical protein